MSSIANKLIDSPIERWIQAVEFVDKSKDNASSKPLALNIAELIELSDKTQFAKRSKPSYQWQVDKYERWYRIWFKESNLIIQIDLYSSDNKYQMNMYEIDVENCTTANSILQWFYHSVLSKKWGSPEILWAIMEILDEGSEKIFGKNLCDALSLKEPLNWSVPKK